MKIQIFVDDNHDYTYTKKKNVHRLYTSKAEHWSDHHRNKLLFEAFDNGDGIKLTKLDSESYDKVSEYGIFLQLINKDITGKIKFYKEI